MKLAVCKLRSASPYSQSRPYGHEVPFLPGETHDAYEERTWRHKLHTMPDGTVFAPPMAFKMALETAAKMLGHQIPGKGKATYTKFFLSGVLCMEPVLLGVKAEDVGRDRIYANADGKRGSGKRVWKNFPRVDEWNPEVAFHLLADEITKDVFEEHVRQAGAFVGVGRFRPQNGGYYGRFQLDKIRWE
jgi:hypothetical protein